MADRYLLGLAWANKSLGCHHRPVHERALVRAELSESQRGVDPGPNGFEAAARGDLDGDGETSLFVITAEVNGTSIRTASSVFQDDHLE